jgi:ABC-type antimicrobial peptide transport system permease subunit
VKSRTREIGVRMAVGAQPARIVGLFSREALLLTASGIGLGLCAYAAANAVFSLWISRILYDLRPWEPIAVVAVVFLVAAIAAIATAPAAIRAVRIDPASALRAE